MKVKLVWSTCGNVTVDMDEKDFGLLNDNESIPCDLDDLETMPNHICDKIRAAITDSLWDNPVEIDDAELVVERKHVGVD